ncbi:MAG: LCP family protein [Clostridia bacterium]|nr:LCP family protein [Clostridia bacterium]
MKKVIFALLLCVTLLSAAACAQEVNHYLLMGFDYWGDTTIGTSFSDTNIILSVDKTNSRILVASIMRDSYVTMPNGKQSKLNQVIRKTDFDTMVRTVELTMGIDIDAYIAISSPGFARLIGELGGIEVDISPEVYEVLKDNENIPGPGKQTLRGNGLLAYVRTRKTSGYDRSRTERAREVMGQMLLKAKDMGLMELMSFGKKALEEVKTDMNPADLISLAIAAVGMKDIKFETYVIPADGTYSYGTVDGNSIVDADWEQNRPLYHAFIAGK